MHKTVLYAYDNKVCNHASNIYNIPLIVRKSVTSHTIVRSLTSFENGAVYIRCIRWLLH